RREHPHPPPSRVPPPQPLNPSGEWSGSGIRAASSLRSNVRPILIPAPARHRILDPPPPRYLSSWPPCQTPRPPLLDLAARPVARPGGRGCAHRHAPRLDSSLRVSQPRRDYALRQGG